MELDHCFGLEYFSIRVCELFGTPQYSFQLDFELFTEFLGMSYFQQRNHTEKTLFPNLIAWRFTIYVCTYHFFKYTVVCSVRTWYPSLSQQISITISTWNATKSSIKVWVSVYCHQILAASTWCHFDPYCICPCYIHPVLECRVRVSRSQSLRLSLTHSLSLWLQFTDAICQVNALFLPAILRIYMCVCLSVHPSVCLPNVLVYGAKKILANFEYDCVWNVVQPMGNEL